MVVIEQTTVIDAPIARCFDLSRSIDLHVQSTTSTKEAAVAGITTGLIGPGEEVTWRAKHLGVWQNFTSKITAFDRPRHFQDCMVRGAFRSFRHDHYFEAKEPETTIMRDVLEFSAPIPFLGFIAELFLRPYMKRFLQERNDVIKRAAESEEWRQFL